ncbi:MAG TPA: acVLRF1 family peptidyl-tRNA hydrolase [Jatrophihabitans sp.]|uniref:acVLRF1 family peptidyl-tRNA hydrolase n=1 Tax=Jatrophihabitans sp. TaxID=1932789 RepID=UPI002E0B77D3|nr:acVLRF1 family peptidyl-tRNA hydrolase [Jatrophihabitans sp.]
MEAPAGVRTVTVAAGRLERWLAGFAERHGDTETVASPTVVALTGADGARAWIDVPFAPLTGSLVEHVTRARRIGVVLVRRGGHAAGLFEGERLVASKVGSSYVQGTTKAGGWSQQRYARRRANQSSAAFADAADAVARVLGSVTDLDAVVAGGDRPAVKAVLADPRLTRLEPLLTDPWLNVKDPKLRVLETMPEQFRVARISLVP